MALALAGCGTQPPKIVYVEVPKIVQVDKKLTEHGEVPTPKNDSGEELLRVARERKSELLQCYGKLDAISELK